MALFVNDTLDRKVARNSVRARLILRVAGVKLILQPGRGTGEVFVTARTFRDVRNLVEASVAITVVGCKGIILDTSVLCNSQDNYALCTFSGEHAFEPPKGTIFFFFIFLSLLLGNFFCNLFDSKTCRGKSKKRESKLRWKTGQVTVCVFYRTAILECSVLSISSILRSFIRFWDFRVSTLLNI